MRINPSIVGQKFQDAVRPDPVQVVGIVSDELGLVAIADVGTSAPVFTRPVKRLSKYKGVIQ